MSEPYKTADKKSPEECPYPEMHKMFRYCAYCSWKEPTTLLTPTRAPDRRYLPAVCPHGDPTCPCPDGDVCHYRDDPKSETLAMACWSPDCTVKEPHERA